MKKIFLSITTLFSLAVVVNAQSPYWSLSGNSNASSTSKLGTTNAVDLRLYTNNSERMRITSAGLVGIGTIFPADKLHVNSASGTNAFRAQVNGGTKLLVHSGGGVSIGSPSAPPANGLYVSGNVGIGTTTPAAKLHVITTAATGTYTSGASYGIRSYATGNGYGVYGYSPYIGVYGYGGSYGSYNYGGSYGSYNYGGTYGSYNYGASYGSYNSSDYTGIYGSGTTYGVYGYSPKETGVFGYTGGGGTAESGVYGYCGGYGYGLRGYSYYGSGVYATGGAYAGYFVGNVYSTGSYQGSDSKLKKNIANLESAMDLINKLQPKTYEFRQDGNYKLMKLPEGKHYGLIAQDLEKVLPQLVKDTKFDTRDQIPPGKQDSGTVTKPTSSASQEVIDFKAVNYTELIPIIIEAMKEQQVTIDKQNTKIESLTLLVNKLSQNSNTTGSVKLNGYLGQSSPNPNSTSARITYNIPGNFTRAELVINDEAGQKIKQMPLNKSGFIDVNTSNLSAGTYFYTLMVNGATVDTKKMVVIRQ